MRALAIFLVLIVGTAITAETAPVSPAGSYRSAGGTDVITLALLPNGNYIARWDLDIFPEYGRAAGTWQVMGDEVRLTPKKEEGRLKDHLRILLVRSVEGRRALLRKEDAQHGKNPFFYFYLKEEPNSERSDPP